MHPTIEAFCRVPGVGACQSTFFNRCQREFRDQIQPMLDERDRLLVENAELTAQLEKSKKRTREAA